MKQSHYIKYTDLRNEGSKVFDEVEKGEQFIVTRRGLPVAQIIPFPVLNASTKGKKKSWQDDFEPIKIKGEPASQTIIKMRRESRY